MKHSVALARGVSLSLGGKDLRSPATAGPFSLFVRPSPPLGANDGRGAPGRLSAPGGMRPGQVGSTEAYDRPCERFWVPFATKSITNLVKRQM